MPPQPVEYHDIAACRHHLPLEQTAWLRWKECYPTSRLIPNTDRPMLISIC